MGEGMGQDDADLLCVLTRMRNGQMEMEDAELLMGRNINNLGEDERQDFLDGAIYIVPMWKDVIPIIRDYLLTIGTPVIKVMCEVSTGRKNYVDTECDLPKTNAFAVESKVMLLVNYIVKYNLFNGAVGTVVDIVYHPGKTSNNSASSAYVVVNFPDFTIPIDFAHDLSIPTNRGVVHHLLFL